MALSITQLLSPTTRDEARATIIANLDSVGFAASSWQEGSVQRDILEIVSVVWADLSSAVKVLTSAVFLDLSSGSLLTGLAKSHFSIERKAAIRARHTVNLTAAATAGPYAIAAGDLVVAHEATGHTHRNVTGGVLAAGGTLPVTFEAEVAGSSRNAAPGELTVLVTPLAGVTCTNPAGPTLNGEDEESDASLKVRCKARWPLLAIELPGDGYAGVALAVSSVARVEVDATNPGGPNTLDVYVAGSDATAGALVVDAVQAAIDNRKAPAAIVSVLPALEQVVNVTATVHVVAAENTSAKQSEIEESARDYINAQAIGGLVLPPSTSGVLDRDSLIGAIKAVAGVVAVAMSVPNADVPIPAHTIAKVGSITLTFTSV